MTLDKLLTQEGYLDYAYPDPGKFEALDCGICGTKMNVIRDVYGPTSFGAAMAHKGRAHDSFSCPHRNEGWHQQAKELLAEIKKTPSRALAAIIYTEFEEVVSTREPSLEKFEK